MEGRPLEDEQQLIERARRGDNAAYERLVADHQGVAFRVAYLVSGDAAEAEDAAQSAFIKAYYALDRFRRGSPFRPWLLKIVGNEARNRRRSAGRRANLALRVAGDRPRDDAAPSPEAMVLASERNRRLLAALEELREEERLVIAYRYLLGLSEAETAATLGVRVGTIKSRASRGLDHLRELLPIEELRMEGSRG